MFPDAWKLEILLNVEANFKKEISTLTAATSKHFPQAGAFAQSADGQRLLGGLKQAATTFQAQRDDAQRRFESLLKEQAKLEVLKRILVAVSQRKVDDALRQDVRKLDEWLVGDGKTRWAQAGVPSRALQFVRDLFAVRSAHAASSPYPGGFSVVVNLNGGGGPLGASISLGVVWDRNGAVKGVVSMGVMLGGIVDLGGDLIYRVHPGDVNTLTGLGMGVSGSAAYYTGGNATIEWSAPYTDPVPTWGYGVSVGMGAQVTWNPGATLVFPKSGNSTPLAAGAPTSINPAWPGLWADRVDAGLVWPGTNKAYFFRGSEYVRYDIAANRVDPGYPMSISSGWAGVFPQDLNEAVVWPNNKAYFFKGNQYVRYDISQ